MPFHELDDGVPIDGIPIDGIPIGGGGGNPHNFEPQPPPPPPPPTTPTTTPGPSPVSPVSNTPFITVNPTPMPVDRTTPSVIVVPGAPGAPGAPGGAPPSGPSSPTGIEIIDPPLGGGPQVPVGGGNGVTPISTGAGSVVHGDPGPPPGGICNTGRGQLICGLPNGPTVTSGGGSSTGGTGGIEGGGGTGGVTVINDGHGDPGPPPEGPPPDSPFNSDGGTIIQPVLNRLKCTQTINIYGEGISGSIRTKKYTIGGSQEIKISVDLFNTNRILKALSGGDPVGLDLTKTIQVFTTRNGNVTSGLLPDITPIIEGAAISVLTAGQELFAMNLAGVGQALVKPFCNIKLPSAQNAIIMAIGSLGGLGRIKMTPAQANILASAIQNKNYQQNPKGSYFGFSGITPILNVNHSESLISQYVPDPLLINGGNADNNGYGNVVGAKSQSLKLSYRTGFHLRQQLTNDIYFRGNLNVEVGKGMTPVWGGGAALGLENNVDLSVQKLPSGKGGWMVTLGVGFSWGAKKRN